MFTWKLDISNPAEHVTNTFLKYRERERERERETSERGEGRGGGGGQKFWGKLAPPLGLAFRVQSSRMRGGRGKSRERRRNGGSYRAGCVGLCKCNATLFLSHSSGGNVIIMRLMSQTCRCTGVI